MDVLHGVFEVVMQSLTHAYEYAGTEDGALVLWGVFLRCFAAIFAISLGALAWQLVPLAGARGITPVREILAAYRRDFGISAYLWWPTVFWLSPSDTALRVIPGIAAVAAAVLALTGGFGYSRFILALCWSVLLSIDAGPNGLLYPWDSFLLEAGALSLALPPASHTPGDMRLTALPVPVHALAFRLLTIRLLTGFGKLKFVGTTSKDKYYIASFCITQPICTPAGWFAYATMHKLLFVPMLFFMFLVEIPLPIAGLLPGWPRALAGAGIIFLMLGIQLTGNFGYFNILTAVMSIPLLQWQDHAFFERSFDTPAHIALSCALIGFFIPASWFYWILNSWVNVGWTHWPSLVKKSPSWLFQHVTAFLRGIASYRLLQAYGVFPPSTGPPQRWSPVYEVCTDGSSWRRCRPQYYISDARRAPAFIAPYHPRFDHAIFYESFSFGAGFLTILAHHNPMNFTPVGPWVRLQLRLLQACNTAEPSDVNALRIFSEAPVAPAGEEMAVRMSFYNFIPSTLSHAMRTGEYYHELYSGTHNPEIRGSRATIDALWSTSLPCGPEEYWWESVYWRRYAEVTNGAISPREYEEAWEFVAFVRHAAGEAAVTEANLIEQDGLERKPSGSTSAATSVSSVRQRRRPSSSGAADASAASASALAADAAVNSNEVCDSYDAMRFVSASASVATGAVGTDERGRLTVVDVLRATHVRVLPPLARLRQAAQHLASDTNVSVPVPVEIADSAFTWAHLPDVYKAISTRYTIMDRIRIRRTILRMIVPVMRSLERLFWRMPPSTSMLQAELGTGTGGATEFPGWRELYGTLGAAISGTPVGPRGHYSSPHDAPVRASVPVDGSSYDVNVYADNDDAGWDGCMRNHVRFGMYATWLMLVSGRAAYERAILTGSTGVVGQRLPTGFTGPGRDDTIARAPLPQLFVALQSSSHTFGHMATEAGTFVLGTMWYDMFASLVSKTAMTAAQNRPNPARASAHMELLPGMVEILPRALVHPELRPAEALRDGPITISAPLRMRRWKFARDGDWSL